MEIGFWKVGKYEWKFLLRHDFVKKYVFDHWICAKLKTLDHLDLYDCFEIEN